MADEIAKLANWLLEPDWPALGCPECGLGFVSVEKLTREETAASCRGHEDSEWGPEWCFGGR